MRVFPRLVPLSIVLAAAALRPEGAAAQRSPNIPPLYVQPVVERDTAAVPDTIGLRFRVGEAPGRGRERQPVAPSTLIAAADAARILDRLRPLVAPPTAADSFAFPARTLPAPRTGRVLLAGFPPPDTAPPPRPAGPREPAPLAIVRAAPRGEVEVGAEVTVTFSQPMVPLSSVGNVEARALSLRMSPQPAGRWRWLDVRTLVFTPEGRMPAATEYTVSVPAGTRSETGGRMAEEAAWTFATPALTATGGHPYGDAVGLEPVIVVQFAQRIDRAAVLPYLRVRAGSETVPVRPATAAEIEGDPTARALAQRGDPVHWIAVRPVRPLPRATRVQVAVATGAPSAEGPRPTRFDQSWGFGTYGPLRAQGAVCSGPRDVCRPGYTIFIPFTNPLDTAAFRAEWVRLEPAVPGVRVHAFEHGIAVNGGTRPNTRYAVHLAAAIRDVFGQTLGAAQVRTVDVGPYYPQLPGFGDPMIVLDPQGPQRVSVYSMAHARLRLRIHRVQPSDWPSFRGVSYDRAPPRLPGRAAVDRVIQVRGDPGAMVETEIDLREVLAGEPGQLVVGVEGVGGEATGQGSYAWVQATRIGLTAFSDAGDVTAWTASLVDGAPLSGVRVSLRGSADAVTDAGGTAELRTPSLQPGREREQEYLVAERDGDRALLPFSAMRGGPPGTLFYALTDRNLYRPGEEVRFKGWARRFERSETGGLDLPAPGEEVEWLARDPRGNEIATGRARLTVLGGFDGAFRLPEGANLGGGSIRFRLAGNEDELGFQVQEFRRPEFEVSIDAPAGPHLVGGSAEVAVRASYFAGGGLPGAAVRWELVSRTAGFTPPGWGAWHFGGHEYAWHRQPPDVPFTRTMEGTTDAEGRHGVRIDFERADPPMAHTLSVRATLEDVNRQTWSTEANLLVHPAEVYVGLRTERAWLTAGEPIEVGIVVVDLDGKVVPGRPVEVTAERLEWRRTGTTWREEVVESPRGCTLVSEANPLSCTIPTGPEGGTFRIVAQVADAQGRPSRTRLTTWAWGRSPWMAGPGEAENAQRVVRLVPDRQEYAPGDTARILVQLPFWPARGLLTVRREGIVRTEPIASDGPTLAVDVPVGEADIPNVYVQVDVVGAHDREGQPQPTARGTDFAAGQTVLRVPPGSRTLQVEATPADSVQTPDSPGSVDVVVRDAAGRPVGDAEVAVVIVDEAVLALTGFRLQHPVQLFYPTWMPGVVDAHLRPLVRVIAMSARGEISGVVVEGQSRQPVAGAIVTVEGTQLRAVTDASGRFRLRDVPRGRQVVQVTRIGFSPATRAVEMGDEPLPELRIEMNAQVIALEDMVVTGEARLERRAAGEDANYALPAPPDPGMLQGKVAGVGVQQPGIAVRADFSALALWAPVVRTDADGRARVPFTLPSNLTRYRVMAVAVSGGTLYGMDESAITARQPLMVRPSAPRFLNFGDRFALPVVVQNQTDAPVEVEVVARGIGIAFTEPGRRVVVPAHDRAEVRIAGEAVRPGTAYVQVAAVGGTMADAAEISLPVYTPATTEAFATYGSIAEGGAVELPLEVPGDAIPAFGGLEVTTSSTALNELTDAFLYLVRYPYECAEQIASRLLAVAALRDVLAEFRAEGLPPAEALADSVQRDLQALQGMQTYDGGFNFWRRDRESWPYISVHVTHALLRVRERGYAIPERMLEPALEYVREVKGHIPGWYPESAEFAIRAYGAYVLDRADDRAAAGRLRELFGEVRLDTIPLEVAGWLLTASAGRREFEAERAEL
ncbi:MAG TPA: alpha-2-macroglobulin family protein, partial [Longimicrobium sp.]|nr:alpha-2-macroglobulin family protein [Longimicrobium sp.]